MRNWGEYQENAQRFQAQQSISKQIQRRSLYVSREAESNKLQLLKLQDEVDRIDRVEEALRIVGAEEALVALNHKWGEGEVLPFHRSFSDIKGEHFQAGFRYSSLLFEVPLSNRETGRKLGVFIDPSSVHVSIYASSQLDTDVSVYIERDGPSIKDPGLEYPDAQSELIGRIKKTGITNGLNVALRYFWSDTIRSEPFNPQQQPIGKFNELLVEMVDSHASPSDIRSLAERFTLAIPGLKDKGHIKRNDMIDWEAKITGRSRLLTLISSFL